MKSRLMRNLIVTLGVSLSGIMAIDARAEDSNRRADVVDAADDYKAPARWNNFRRPAASTQRDQETRNRMPFGATVHSVATQHPIEDLPVPTPENSAAVPMPPQPAATPVHADHPVPVSSDSYASPYAAATSAPWAGSQCGDCAPTIAAPKPIAPWFGGANLLFWNVSDAGDSPWITYDNGVTAMRQNELNPSGDVGFDVHLGRYFGCGQYAIDVGYMLWDPDCFCRRVPDGGAGLRLINPALNTVSINRGGGATSIYDEYDVNAAAIQTIRDLRIQSLEINLTCFGLMGARRLGACGPGPICGGACGILGCRGKYCGGATGPLARACGGRLRIQNSHGFRWFQLEDELEIAGDVDGTSGYGADDLYYKTQTENNLFGYQFGSRLTYCLGCRTMINLGGKIGVYGNDAQFFHSINTTSVVAYTDSQGAGAGDLYTEQSDISMAGLGELDLGLGYRLSSCWTVHGGYRVLAACGVATAVGQMPAQYTSAASAGSVRADDCLMLHGAYIGFDYNW